MKRTSLAASALLFAILQTPTRAPAQGLEAAPPGRFGVDAPELAPLGSYAVGVRTLHLGEPAQPDVLAFDSASGKAPKHVRELTVDLWYPAAPRPGAAVAVYSAQFPSEPPLPPASFSVTGLAVRDAPAAGKAFPLVVVSHGYSNDPAAMIWLTENLASKGYVVAGIHHDDPPITDRAKFIGPLLRRPLDIAYVTQSLQHTLGSEGLIDPTLTALIGYSMGGYGVLTAAGATLDPQGPPTQMVPGGLLLPYVRGGAQAGDVTVQNLKAVVAISPAGGGTLKAWGADGLRDLDTPMLLIQGDHDRTVDYATGARAIFEGAVNAPRYLLTLIEAGHSIGLESAARIDAQAPLGSGMVPRSGLESRARQCHQRPFHHGVSGSLRQGRRIARSLSEPSGRPLLRWVVAGAGTGSSRHSLRSLQSGIAGHHGVERLPAERVGGARTAAFGNGTVCADRRGGRVHRRTMNCPERS